MLGREPKSSLRSRSDVAREVAAEWASRARPRAVRARAHSFVAPAGEDAVLKVTPPEDESPTRRRTRSSSGTATAPCGCCGTTASGARSCSSARGPERTSPALPDDEATAIAVAAGLKLWRPAAEPFRWIGDHVPRWLERASRTELAPLARELYASLDVGRTTLVHGDFHHHNILRSARGAASRSTRSRCSASRSTTCRPSSGTRFPHRLRVELLEARLAAFAAAGLDEERMRKWTVIRGAYLQPQEAEALRALV